MKAYEGVEVQLVFISALVKGERSPSRAGHIAPDTN
jgi:hypothetical protein